MLICAWISSFAISTSQLAIFPSASHSCDVSLEQCIASDYISLLDSRYVLNCAGASYVNFIQLCVTIDEANGELAKWLV